MNHSLINTVLDDEQWYLILTPSRSESIQLIQELYNKFSERGQSVVATSATEQGVQLIEGTRTIHDQLYLGDSIRSFSHIISHLHTRPTDLSRITNHQVLIVNEIEMLSQAHVNKLIFIYKSIQRYAATLQFALRSDWRRTNLINAIRRTFYKLTGVEYDRDVMEFFSTVEYRFSTSIEDEPQIVALEYICNDLIEFMEPYRDLIGSREYKKAVMFELFLMSTRECFSDLVTKSDIIGPWEERYQYVNENSTSYGRIIFVSMMGLNRPSLDVETIISDTFQDSISVLSQRVIENHRECPEHIRLILDVSESNSINHSMMAQLEPFRPIIHNSIDGIIRFTNALHASMRHFTQLSSANHGDFSSILQSLIEHPNSYMINPLKTSRYIVYEEVGSPAEIDVILENRWSPSVVHTKLKMRVMLTRSGIYHRIDSDELHEVTIGMLGTLISYRSDGVIVRLDDDTEIIVTYKLSWVEDHGTIYTRLQIPIRVGYSMSLLEAHSIPFSSCIIDLTHINSRYHHSVSSRIIDGDLRVLNRSSN